MTKLKINKKKYSLPEEKRLLDFLREQGIEVATLCDHADFSCPAVTPLADHHQPLAACRLCLVKCKRVGEEKFKLEPACALKVSEGMEIITEDAEIAELRKINLELLFAEHAGLCSHCVKNKDCELQNLAIKYDIDEFKFAPRLSEIESNEEIAYLYEKMRKRMIDRENPCLVRDSEKCIACGRCVEMCKNFQSVEAYSLMGSGAETIAGTEFNTPLECVYCGQCTAVCPTAALTEKEEIKEFNDAVKNPHKKVIVQIAPSVRVSLGEEFGMPPGTIVTGKMITAVRECGADLVFDTNLGADLTVVEESTELLERLKKKTKPLPLFTSCCPAWVLFLEQHYPEFLDHLSTCRSPSMMLASLIKNYYAKQNKFDPRDLFVVSIMPCVAKKYEAQRKEYRKGGIREADCVLTTRELGKLIRSRGLNLAEMEDSDFDSTLGIASSAGAIFGSSGGVTEAALRTVHYLVTGEDYKKIVFKKTRGSQALKEIQVKIGNLKLKTKIVYGLGNARCLLEDLKKGKADFDFLEVMACPGGCIGGGGQPVPTDFHIRAARAKAIYHQDSFLPIRMSHRNPILKEIYGKYLGSYGSPKAKKYLHTGYYPYRYKFKK